MSQGWRRTVGASAPSYGVDYVILGAVDKQYAAIENNPFADGEIVLKMAVQGEWRRRRSNKGTRPADVGYVALFDTVGWVGPLPRLRLFRCCYRRFRGCGLRRSTRFVPVYGPLLGC